MLYEIARSLDNDFNLQHANINDVSLTVDSPDGFRLMIKLDGERVAGGFNAPIFYLSDARYIDRLKYIKKEIHGRKDDTDEFLEIISFFQISKKTRSELWSIYDHKNAKFFKKFLVYEIASSMKKIINIYPNLKSWTSSAPEFSGASVNFAISIFTVALDLNHPRIEEIIDRYSGYIEINLVKRLSDQFDLLN